MTATLVPSALTPDQRRIVEWGDGPVVVIAGAGTGKTRVIVERVAHLLRTREDLLPEQILVLTYNVKAAHELQERLDEAVGVATRSRISVSNFHSFCQRNPDRVRRGRRPAAPSGRAGRRGAGAPAPRHQPHAVARLPLAVELGARRLRPAHQPRQGRAGDPGRLRRLRGRGAPGLRGAIRQLRCRRRAARDPGQSRPDPEGPVRLREGPCQRARRGPPLLPRRRGAGGASGDRPAPHADRRPARTRNPRGAPQDAAPAH